LAGRPPQVDLELERGVQTLVRTAIDRGLLASAHDSSDGGVAVALAECSIASGRGADLELTVSRQGLARALFAEGGARVLVSVKAECRAEWDGLAAESGIPVTPLGVVTAGHRFLLRGAEFTLDCYVDQLQRAHQEALPRRIGSDAES